MQKYGSEEYDVCRKWVRKKIEAGHDWIEVERLCADKGGEETAFAYLKSEELIIPDNMVFSMWKDFIQYMRSRYKLIVDPIGIAAGNKNDLPIPDYGESAWVRYKSYLLGRKTGKPKLAEESVDMMENNCHWVLNYLKRDTTSGGPVKGLVMGSVQSGKTANMIGLVTMAADYGWNIFIVLSGTIDNLRKQTRDRFRTDLRKSGGFDWHIMENTRASGYMTEIVSGERYLSDDLNLEAFKNRQILNKKTDRYVFVCLKNSRRLQNLVTWLHSSYVKSKRMRILLIDDEADQASINTAKMGDETDEEHIERTKVNKLIINLVNGCEVDGKLSEMPFQAMNYISFTATPYANVLNESYKNSLYPSDFICSLLESKEYFGTKVIWGSKSDEKYSGLNILRTIGDEEISSLKELHKGHLYSVPTEMAKSVAWFLCAASILRKRGNKKPISMLIHTTAKQNGHYEVNEALKTWLKKDMNELLSFCEDVYLEEKNAFRLTDLREGYPEYAKLQEVNDEFPEFAELKEDISQLIRGVTNISMEENGELKYTDTGLHICVDNCSAQKMAEDGTYLRVIYPTGEEISKMNQAPVFIVMGGNTLSRGLTLEGLVCTYFARDVNQVDTLMQMARWFGYRPGYELLQRIWMSVQVQQKFELIEEIDERLKSEIEDFMEKGKSPSTFGPRIMNSSGIAKFKLTSKNKSQNMVSCNIDFTGDSYEITKFDESEQSLQKNLDITTSFLERLGNAKQSKVIDSSYVWNNIDSDIVLADFLEKFQISECSSLNINIRCFIQWMKKMNEDGKYLKWNVVVAGNKSASERWRIAGADVGKIERSRKRHLKYIDIGSLRSGRDILSDIDNDRLSAEADAKFRVRMKTGRRLIALRDELGYSDIPVLLLYRIDKEKGKESKSRMKIGTETDIIGFSIVIAGGDMSMNHVKTVTIRIVE